MNPNFCWQTDLKWFWANETFWKKFRKQHFEVNPWQRQPAIFEMLIKWLLHFLKWFLSLNFFFWILSVSRIQFVYFLVFKNNYFASIFSWNMVRICETTCMFNVSSLIIFHDLRNDLKIAINTIKHQKEPNIQNNQYIPIWKVWCPFIIWWSEAKSFTIFENHVNLVPAWRGFH